MPSAVTTAILHVIRQAGYGVGGGTLTSPNGQVSFMVNAIRSETGESFSVTAPTQYDAAVELAQQAGIDLEDG